MFSVILGVALVVGGCGTFWYLLPRHGQVHPLVSNSDVGSLITIGIISVITAGMGFLVAGLAG